MQFAVRCWAAMFAVVPAAALAAAGWSVDDTEGSVRFFWEGKAVARYVYGDPKTPRPYFADVCAPSGVQVTRNHPPVAGKDRMDHPEFHPGLWLAFGDLNGADNWRLKAQVRHQSFSSQPTVEADGALGFTVENHYLDAAGDTVCSSTASHTLRVTPLGLLVTYDETFQSGREFVFGDQEEMGLGFRLATPLRVENGGPDPAPSGTGEILADGGRRGSAEIWGQPAQWLDYRGQIEGKPAGIALFCHPDNFRPSRMHARDYGFVCANPFATAAFKAGEASRTVIAAGESLRLRYGVLCHSGERLTVSQLDEAYEDYAAGRRQ